MTQVATKQRTIKRHLMNTSMQNIYLKSLSVDEASQVLKASYEANCRSVSYQGEKVSVPKRFFTMKQVPTECSCCKVKVDSFAITIIRADFAANDESTNTFLVATASGKYINVDHIIPQSLGGLDIAENMRFTCMDCNVTKGNKISTDEVESVLNILPNLVNVKMLGHVYLSALNKYKKLLKQYTNGCKGVTDGKVAHAKRTIDSTRPVITALHALGIKPSSYIKVNA